MSMNAATALCTETSFEVGGARCAATLWEPQAGRARPGVVIVHGFGCTRAMRLRRFVGALLGHDLAVLTYDPRCLGESEGLPRQLVDPAQLVDDARAALARLGREPLVSRLGLLGLSLGGGVAMRTAVDEPSVAALAHVVGFTRSAMARSDDETEALVAAAFDDAAASDAEPVLVPICGWPGETAVIATYDAMYGMALLDESGEERNEVAARSLVGLSAFTPGDEASRLSCPVLYYACENDVVTPFDRPVVEATASRELVTYRGSHFDVFHGQRGAHAAATAAAFLAHALDHPLPLTEDRELGTGPHLQLGVAP